MTAWTAPLEKLPPRELEVWDTNDRIYEEWCKATKKRGAKNTQRTNISLVGVFMRMNNALVTTLQSHDIEAFLDRMGLKCSRLMLSKDPECRGHFFDITACPLLRGATEYVACAGYKPLDPVTIWGYICVINRFYEWLLEEQRVKSNPALKVMRNYASRHGPLFVQRRRKPRRRNLSIEEVCTLVLNSPINHGIGYVAMSKGMLRIHEFLKLDFEPNFFNLDEGWMDIPMNWDLGDKRKGNMRIILDAEFKRWIRQYRVWWEEHVERDENGNPTHTRFAITIFGRPWGEAAIHNFNTALHKNAMEVALMTGMETERWERINSHTFRAFGTTEARDRGAQDADVQIMRGDLAPGSIERYDAYLRRLPELYSKYGPVLGI